MRVLFAHPYHLALDPHEEGVGKPYPPLSPLIVAAKARAAGFDVAFHDAMYEKDERRFEDVVRGYDRVAILGDDHSVQMKMCLGRIKQAHLAMIAAAKRAGASVVVSGPDVSDHPAHYLEAGADGAIVGEAVEAVVSWLRDEPGIVGLHGGRGAGGRAKPLDDLDALPLPAWDLTDLRAYRDRWRARHGYWEMAVSTSRGCPYRCNWCAKPTWGRTYHSRSPEVVAHEVAELTRRYAPDRIWFTDDIFALKASWLRAYRDAQTQAGLVRVVPYRCLSRADLVQEDSFAADLAATGCREVWMGAESGADSVLEAMDKDGSVDEIRRATALLRGHGIRVGFFLQLGYPGEGLPEIEDTVAMVKALRPDDIGVSVTYPLPGTVFHGRVAATMGDTHWDGSMENRPLYEAPFDQAFYGAAKEVLRSVHSAAWRTESVQAFLTRPSRRNARRVVGAAWHTVRLPWVRRRMLALAVPNERAVRIPAGT
jgi:anaerobic magnesium-protoporphyrin IX monomethyl ester cyclase